MEFYFEPTLQNEAAWSKSSFKVKATL